MRASKLEAFVASLARLRIDGAKNNNALLARFIVDAQYLLDEVQEPKKP